MAGKFGTAINCMDGRVQKPVMEYLRWHHGLEFVDTVTDAGPVGLLVDAGDSEHARRLLRCVQISIQAHGSRLVAVVAHHDCAGFKAPEDRQKKAARVAADTLRRQFPDVQVVPLWVGSDWRAVEITVPATG